MEKHGPHLKPEVNSGAPEGLAVPDPHVLLQSICFKYILKTKV